MSDLPEQTVNTPADEESPVQAAPEAEPSPEDELPEWAKAKLHKANREAQNLRNRVRDLEPLAQEAAERREAEKTDLQRATDRTAELEQQLAQANLLAEINGLAATHQLPEADRRFIVGNTAEERAESARAIAEKNAAIAAVAQQPTPPPTNRPATSLRPGASPAAQDNSAPTAYPPEWIPRNRARDKG